MLEFTIEKIILVASVLLFISILAGKTSFRLGIPTLILFLAVGMLAGSEGIGGIPFNNPGIAQFIGVIALNFILFSGGFETDWTSAKPVFGQALTLSVIGVLLTAGLVGLFVWWVTDFTIFAVSALPNSLSRAYVSSRRLNSVAIRYSPEPKK